MLIMLSLKFDLVDRSGVGYVTLINHELHYMHFIKVVHTGEYIKVTNFLVCNGSEKNDGGTT